MRAEVKWILSNPEIIDEVFEKFVNNCDIFINREVLRHDYLPERLPHREKTIRRLAETVAPVLKSARCSNAFLYGKTGTGKTAVTKYVLNRLEIKAKQFEASVRICYVNCRLAGTKYRVFSKLCQSLGGHIPFTGLSVGEVFDRLRLCLESVSIIFVVVLDEIDALIKARGDNILYELLRINEMLTDSKVSLVGISNDLRLKEFLDSRVLSSLSEEEIVFKPYDAEELRNILADRAQLAFYDTALTDGALSLCAALAAAEHGDARRALDLLRVAGEVAERYGAEFIEEEHVRDAERHIEHNRTVEALRTLTLHLKLVLLSLFHLGQADVQRGTTGEIYEVYNDLCGELGTGPLTQRRVSTLINELDSLGLLNAKVISRGRYGRTKRIRLEVARPLLKKVFSEDSRVKDLVGYKLKGSSC